MRLEKVKSVGADRIEFGGHRKKRKRRRKERFGLIKDVSLLSQEDNRRMTISISKSG